MEEENTTETVSAGEVCSIEVAKQLGIANIANNRHYINSYSDVTTFKENDTNFYKLCETTRTDNSRVAPLCVLQSNAGFGFTKNRSSGSIEYDKCITSECPTEFTEDPTNPNSCIKPRRENRVLENTLSEERWYDWFMIPDYHLGNKYTRVDNKNYGPCIKGTIPSYGTDPVDNTKLSAFKSRNDEIEKCVPKDIYFRGKYGNSETYCPMTWIFRAGATKTDLKNIYLDLINRIENTKNGGNENLDALKKKIDTLIHDDIYTPVVQYDFKDYVGEPNTAEAKLACSYFANDPDKKDLARQICSTISDVGKEKYIERLMNDNTEDEITAKKKYIRAIQACHTIFCDKSSSQICFKEVGQANLEKEIELEEKKKAEEERERPPIDSNNAKILASDRVRYIMMILLIITGCIFGLLVFAFILYPPLNKYVFINIRNYIIKPIIALFGFCMEWAMTKEEKQLAENRV
jgi:hypothetical protein